MGAEEDSVDAADWLRAAVSTLRRYGLVAGDVKLRFGVVESHLPSAEFTGVTPGGRRVEVAIVLRRAP